MKKEAVSVSQIRKVLNVVREKLVKFQIGAYTIGAIMIGLQARANEPVFIEPVADVNTYVMSSDLILEDAVADFRIEKRAVDTERYNLFCRNEKYLDTNYQTFNNAINQVEIGMNRFSPDFCKIDVSDVDECAYAYFEKNGEMKGFFNLFFDKNTVEASVNVNIRGNYATFDGNIEDGFAFLADLA